MDQLNKDVLAYTEYLREGKIQRAYRGIMEFMSSLRVHFTQRHPDASISAMYFGYMDMTYFAFTPLILKEQGLKVAIVYLHETYRFEIWLGAVNRKVQGEFIHRLSNRPIMGYTLNTVKPGEDAIIATVLVDQPDFDQPEQLKEIIDAKTIGFIEDMKKILIDD